MSGGGGAPPPPPPEEILKIERELPENGVKLHAYARELAAKGSVRAWLAEALGPLWAKEQKTQVMGWGFDKDRGSGRTVYWEINSGYLVLNHTAAWFLNQVHFPPCKCTVKWGFGQPDPPDRSARLDENLDSDQEESDESDNNPDARESDEDEADVQPDGPGPCNGRTWSHVENGVPMDQRSKYGGKWRASLKLKGGKDIKTASIWDVFAAVFPSQLMDSLLQGVNTNPRMKGAAAFSEYEIMQCLGILVANTIRPSGDMFRMWETERDGKETFFAPGDVRGRWGLSSTRFKLFKECLKWWEDPLDIDDEYKRKAALDDPWHRIRGLLDDFNETMMRVFSPSWKNCVDETMWPWLGRGDFDTRGVPHITKIPRKPKGVGVEVKDIACAGSGIVHFLEIQVTPHPPHRTSQCFTLHTLHGLTLYISRFTLHTLHG